MPSFIYPLLAVVQVLSALTVIGLVLLQQGKGADMGSSFGGGSAGSLFGATGAANFFSRATKWVSILFFACTLGLAYIGNNTGRTSGPATGGGVMQGYEAPAPATTPAPAAQPQADLPVAPAPAETPAAPSASGAPTAPSATPAAPATQEQSGATPAAPATESKPAVENTTPAAPESQQGANTDTKQ
ncbi:preprotein translocase subunit SecG [Advenella mimigardefordensis]|uniref:Protein-export membrane protein SecG n=1 Tax=Advenella mimigardefordensis (strain DSM 17166 / LMG 22922 / DPN7) TaxID=1247726 RepID=W0PHW6_ADVMD|nr:preprotein translocase subunit SecG [Advenella mimigardefordensis]AHG64538.1 putative preprotein translocase subunit SecG [Advenella mimigardefordensis DPN7]